MAPPEVNIEMVMMVENLPNDCIDFSISGGAARDETAIAILLSKHQRAKTVEVHRQGPAITLRIAADVRNTVASEAVRRVVHGFKHSYLACIE